MIGKPNIYIYKAKSEKKSIIITEKYVCLQDYILKNKYSVGLKIIERDDDLKFYLMRGIVLFDCHLRISKIPVDIKKLNGYHGNNPIVLIAPPFFVDTNAFNELAGFKVVDVSVGEGYTE